MVNKFLYPKGGAETYTFKLGQALVEKGHEVQYFGMEHEGRCVGNNINSYTSRMDFHNGNLLLKWAYPIRTIYSSEARKKIRRILDDFYPDIVHLNNFNYQLTPSIILEIVKWRKQRKRICKIVYTAHDYQLICPNHLLRNPNTEKNCEECLSQNYWNCLKGRCVHGSGMKSLVGTLEAFFWKYKGVYEYLDAVICCSNFMKERLDKNPIFRGKTVVLHNFVERVEVGEKKKEYILYFGRYAKEKGVETLLQVCRNLEDMNFVFAGAGPLEKQINQVSNIQNVGFLRGEELKHIIQQARFSVYPSEWYENCPFAVLESIAMGTPVLGADIGGIPELIREGRTGHLFVSGNADDLKQKILLMWENTPKDAIGFEDAGFDTLLEYTDKIIHIYQS